MKTKDTETGKNVPAFNPRQQVLRSGKLLSGADESSAGLKV